MCYRTAWRHWAVSCSSTTPIWAADAYLGGERNGGKPRRGPENKQPFAIAVSTDENLEYPTFAVIEPVRSFDSAALDWSRPRLAADASDGLACFRRVVDLDHAHTVLETPGGRAATQIRGARWVNVVLGNVKHAISGCYHAMRQAKYARRYLTEVAYWLNRHFHMPSVLPRLACAMMLCRPCAEPILRAATNFVG